MKTYREEHKEFKELCSRLRYAYPNTDDDESPEVIEAQEREFFNCQSDMLMEIYKFMHSVEAVIERQRDNLSFFHETDVSIKELGKLNSDLENLRCTLPSHEDATTEFTRRIKELKNTENLHAEKGAI